MQNVLYFDADGINTVCDNRYIKAAKVPIILTPPR